MKLARVILQKYHAKFTIGQFLPNHSNLLMATKGNKLMAKIHNNPKLIEPRMPVILPLELEDKWIDSIHDEVDIKQIQELIQEFPQDELKAHTVAKLRGNEYPGNVKGISEKVDYEELNF
jgi:putative SOS response-associated peptidase YedK